MPTAPAATADFARVAQRSQRLRIYPTLMQRRSLARMFGTARFVWNWALRARSSAYRDPELIEAAGFGLSLSGVDLSRYLTAFKQEPGFEWLAACPSTVLTQKLRDQEAAFRRFYDGLGRYPKPRRREAAQSARCQLDPRHAAAVRGFLAGKPSLPGLGALKTVWSRGIPITAPKLLTISQDGAGRYFLSFMVEERMAAWPEAPIASTGLDLGARDLIVAADGWRQAAPRSLKRRLRRLRRAQRALARKVKGSNRARRQRRRIAKLHARISDERSNALHQASSAALRRYQWLGIEHLQVQGMLRNHNVAPSLADAGLGALRRQLEYKADWHHRQVVRVDRFFPSSQLCSTCGFRNRELGRQRRWSCPACHTDHDRDLNAAINLQREALRISSNLAESSAPAPGRRCVLRVEGDTSGAAGAKVPAVPASVETRTRKAKAVRMQRAAAA